MNRSIFVIVITYIKTLAEIDEYLEEHRCFLDGHYQTGQFICSGRQNPRKGEVIMCCGDTKGEIERIVEEDPFSRHGLAMHEIIQFVPYEYSKDFEQLLKQLV